MVLSQILLAVFLCPSSVRLAANLAHVAWSRFYPQGYSNLNPASVGYLQAIWLAIPLFLFSCSLLALPLIPSRSYLAGNVRVRTRTWIRAWYLRIVSRFLNCPCVSWDLVRCAKKRMRTTTRPFDTWSCASHFISSFLRLFFLTFRPRQP